VFETCCVEDSRARSVRARSGIHQRTETTAVQAAASLVAGARERYLKWNVWMMGIAWQLREM
jgi:hypothetical protein